MFLLVSSLEKLLYSDCYWFIVPCCLFLSLYLAASPSSQISENLRTLSTLALCIALQSSDFQQKMGGINIFSRVELTFFNLYFLFFMPI